MLHTEGATVSKLQSRSGFSSAADIKIHEFISKQIDVVKSMGMTQRDIAEAVGYDKPAMINMFKAGTVKVPLEKVPALAKALHVDPGFLFRLALMQYWKNDADAIAQVFGTVLTANEVKIIDKIRAVSKESDPPLTRDAEAKLKAAFGV
jgi:transcriptional regulator with XRE-family HTH domain